MLSIDSNQKQQRTFRQKGLAISARLLFLLLTTTTMVFFSEKAYWYPQGYVIGELILFYAFPVFACLWAIEHFRVRRLSAVVLVASLYAFLIEGVLTPVIYEAGLLDPIMPAYFIGWHGLLSVVFGWYLIRKWLVAGQWKHLLAGGALFGLFWGLWAITYWLPEIIAEWQQAAAAGEAVIPGVWPLGDFALHTFTFTLMLICAHWLLGRIGWQPTFQPNIVGKVLVMLILIFFFSTMVLPVMPLAIFKLVAMVGIILATLRTNRRRESSPSLLAELVGSVKFSHALVLLTMPLAATLVYGGAMVLKPTEDLLRLILELTPLLQALVGAGMFMLALIMTLIPQRKAKLVEAM